MRGVITKVHPTHYEVRCDAINETVNLSAFDVRPMSMNKNLREQLSNSNSEWAEGSHIDFELEDWKINGRFIARHVTVCLQGR